MGKFSKIFGGGGQVAPPAPPPPPVTDNAAVEAAKRDALAVARKKRGYAATNLTGGAGDTSVAPVEKTKLGE